MRNAQTKLSAVFHQNRHWILIVVVIVMVSLNRLSGGLSGATATATFAVAILLSGIPHGTLDIEIIAQNLGRKGGISKLAFISVYMGFAAAMAALWLAFAELALVVFLAISIVHFGRDWRLEEEPFLGFMVGGALIALPALSHNAEVAALFDILTGSRAGHAIADGLACISLPPLLASLVFCGVAVKQGRMPIAVNVAICLVAAITLPPLAAFAVFFCGLHSPRHFRDALQEAGDLSAWQKAAIIISVTALALGMGALVFVHGSTASVNTEIVRTAFVLLSILTLPHFLLEQFIPKMARA
jgi:beta-carotene 15,15'-dioxygenase